MLYSFNVLQRLQVRSLVLQTLQRTFEIEDEMGKSMPAIDVFSASIRYLTHHLLDECRKQLPDILNVSIQWLNDHTCAQCRKKLAGESSVSEQWLKEHLCEQCHKQLPADVNNTSIRWVITVPAIWNEPAKQFMRECAIKVFQ